jgi:hypothetical protein
MKIASSFLKWHLNVKEQTKKIKNEEFIQINVANNNSFHIKYCLLFR